LFSAKEHPEFPNERWLVEKRYVKPGKYYDENVEILEGLSDNEHVVVTGFQDLANGQEVKTNYNPIMIEN